MPTDPLKLAALMAADLPAPDDPKWDEAMRRLITRGHLAAWMAGTGERLGVKVDSPLLSQKRLSRAEREEIRRVVDKQLEYLRGFEKARGEMSEAAVMARSDLYPGSVKSTFYSARYGDWEIPDSLMPGMQECITRCRCTISVADNGDGTGTLTRTLHAEASCSECPPLAGEHEVRRRDAGNQGGSVSD